MQLECPLETQASDDSIGYGNMGINDVDSSCLALDKSSGAPSFTIGNDILSADIMWALKLCAYLICHIFQWKELVTCFRKCSQTATLQQSLPYERPSAHTWWSLGVDCKVWWKAQVCQREGFWVEGSRPTAAWQAVGVWQLPVTISVDLVNTVNSAA